jgi:hypothetical protein
MYSNRHLLKSNAKRDVVKPHYTESGDNDSCAPSGRELSIKLAVSGPSVSSGTSGFAFVRILTSLFVTVSSYFSEKSGVNV